jgi:acyl-[acyl carrier protein]--UDP-N-acetylglucosamine O-acyltransferase
VSSNSFVHPTAIVDSGAILGDGTKIWHFAHVFAGARIGRKCIFGQNTMVADGVVIGDNVKVQNNVAIYTGTVIEDDVFLGPSCVLTNVTNPRSQVNRHSLYEKNGHPPRFHRGRERDDRLPESSLAATVSFPRAPSSPGACPTTRSWSACRRDRRDG